MREYQTEQERRTDRHLGVRGKIEKKLKREPEGSGPGLSEI